MTVRGIRAIADRDITGDKGITRRNSYRYAAVWAVAAVIEIYSLSLARALSKIDVRTMRLASRIGILLSGNHFLSFDGSSRAISSERFRFSSLSFGLERYRERY